MAIGWNNTDYSNYTLEEISKEYVDDAKAIMAFTLIKQIKEGDIICCTNNAYGLWGIGIATSSYRFKENIHKAGVDDDGEEAYYSHFILMLHGFVLKSKDLYLRPTCIFMLQKKCGSPMVHLHKKIYHNILLIIY